MKLRVEDLDFSIEDKQILKNISLNIEKGDFFGLIGPNGSGKSTLLKNIYRVLSPDSGSIFLDDTSIKELSIKESAKKMSVFIQENHLEFDMNVLDLVLLGRYAHKKMFEDNNAVDINIAKEALQRVGMLDYINRGFLSLSGGEKQRILLAKVLAQGADFIVLDEPTNHLDIHYQYQIMSILKDHERTVFSSIHDLNIAAMYCNKVIILDEGKVKKIGKTEDLLTSKMIEEVFRIPADVSRNEVTGQIQIHYYPI